MITRADVADLQPGDVVELRSNKHPGIVTTGPLRDDGGRLLLGPNLIRCDDGSAPFGRDALILTVVSRAPRLYVNHPRTEPVAGDVVAAAEPIQIVPGWLPTWVWTSNEKWVGTYTGRPIVGEMISPLRLLVDGETGQVVQ